MENAENARMDGEVHARPFQFSLRTMFIVTTIVAVWCSGLFAPYAVARLVTLAIWVFSVPIVLVVMVIYARGYMRTFAIGGLLTTAPLFIYHFIAAYAIVAMAFSSGTDFSTLMAMDDADESRFVVGLFSIGYTVVIFVSGFLAMGVRGLVELPQRAQARRAIVRPPHDIIQLAAESVPQDLANDPA
jgi:hypothetical protein